MYYKMAICLLLAVFFYTACSSPEQKQVQATWEAEQYPWAVYPISAESKAALCQALALQAEDDLCREDTEIMFADVVQKIKELFPVGETTYDEVEIKLASFPYSVEESRQPDGTLVGLWYVYRLTEYKGACIYFQIDLNDGKTIDRIGSSSLGSGPIPTTCGPPE